MVPLETRSEYLKRVLLNSKLNAFYNFLSNSPDIIDHKCENDAEEIYFGIVSSILNNNNPIFLSHYNKKSKSIPSKDSPLPYINDDFLVFCIIVGVKKFKIDNKWISNLVSIRQRTPVTITFENILKEDYYSKSNLSEIVVVYSKLIDIAIINKDLIDTAYKNIIDNTNLFDERNDFHILCGIIAYDYIILLKDPPNCSEISLLSKFNTKFNSRVKILGWFVQTVIFLFFCYCLIKISSKNTSVKIFFDQLNIALKILGIIGFSQISNIIPQLRRLLNVYIMRAMGYPKDLIKSEIKKD